MVPARYSWFPIGEDQKSIGVGDIVVYADATINPAANGRAYAIVRKVGDQSPHVELQLAQPGDIALEGEHVKIQREPAGPIKQRVPWIGLVDGGDQPRWNFLG